MKHSIRTLFIAIPSVVCLIFCAINYSLAKQDAHQDIQKIAFFYNQAQFQEAMRQCKLLADRGNIEGYLNLAVILKDACHYTEAIGVLDKARKEFKDDLRVLSLLARLYYLNAEFDRAISGFKDVLRLQPDAKEANLYLGLCYEEKGSDAQAEQYLERALSFDTGNVIARLHLANIYYRQGKFKDALPHYAALRSMDASLIDVQKSLADIFFRLENFEESYRIYHKLSLIAPADALVKERLAMVSGKLGPGYFAKEREKIIFSRQAKKVFVKPFPEVKDIMYVRIGIADRERSVSFQCSVPFEIKKKKGSVKIFNGIAGAAYRINLKSAGKFILSLAGARKLLIETPIIIAPLEPSGALTIFDVKVGASNFWAAKLDRSYRGAMEVVPGKDGLTLINIVNLEEYLYSVLPSEMPAGWAKEALKAQAVASRSEANLKLGRHRKEGFDFCAEVHCQAYAGVEQETPATNQAVDETRGVAMFFNNKPVDAVYSSNCAGHTQDNIFADQKDIPYLRGRFDSLEDTISFPLAPFELERWLREPPQGLLCDTRKSAAESNFRWVRIYNAEEMNALLNKVADFKEARKILVVERKKSGHVHAIKVIGRGATAVLEKELAIRKALGNLRSSEFTVEVALGPDKKPQYFSFFGGGWGHGVGMCQQGAGRMAGRGKDYQQILRHYFQGVEFKKVY